jgi:hypothetical protein
VADARVTARAGSVHLLIPALSIDARFGLSEPQRRPSSTNPGDRIRLTFGAIGEGAQGRLTIASDTRDDIYSWRLACNFPVMLVSRWDSTELPRSEFDGEFEWTALAPHAADGTILAGDSIELDYAWVPGAVLPPVGERRCTFNGFPVVTEFPKAQGSVP